MLPVILTVCGAALMLAGVVTLMNWIGGKDKPLGGAVFARRGSSKNDRQVIDLYYIVTVLGPLLCGAVMLAFGLRRWL
jgi:hypothetical protein